MPFIYPTAIEMFQIEPELVAKGRAGRVGLDIFPMRNRNVPKVRWSQKDMYYGLQQLRGLDGAPTHVQRLGLRTYEYEPGVFGEYMSITEQELTTRAASIDINAVPIDVGDLVTDNMQYLIGRELDRMESSVWTLLTTGTLNIKIDDVLRGTQYGYSDSYTMQTFTAAVPWSTFATAVPIQNFQSVQQLQVGRSVDFGAGATAYMNQVTANRMINNANSADLGGRRNQYGATLNNLPGIASYFQAQNLPKVVVYDGGYFPNRPTPGSNIGFKKFIPDGTVVVVGRRTTGEDVGEYMLTRNASNGFRPGSYQYVIDRANAGGASSAEKRTPANIEIHRGHNGGPALYFPSAIVLMSV